MASMAELVKKASSNTSDGAAPTVKVADSSSLNANSSSGKEGGDA